MVWAELIVDFLDVGEGDAIHIQGPTGEHILIDTGNIITGHRIVHFLKQRGVHELTALIVTHPHPDHMSGVFTILENFPVKRIYDNGQKILLKKENDFYRWYVEYLRERPNYNVLNGKKNLQFGALKLEVLWPHEAVSRNWNANSIVLRVIYEKTSFLLMADAGRVVENELMQSNTNLKSDVIKIGHHGHSDASGKDFLKQISPRFAVISVNRDNIRGYPSQTVLDRLRNLGITTVVTSIEGDIQFVSDGNEVRIGGVKE